MDDDLTDMPDWDLLAAAGRVGPLPGGLGERSRAHLHAHRALDAVTAPLSVALLGQRTRRRRLVLPVAVGTAAAVLGVLTMTSVGSGPRDTVTADDSRPASSGVPQEASAPTDSSVSSADLFGGLCEPYSPTGLHERDFAFDGTVVSVERAANGRPVTTLAVEEWFKGGSDATVTVPTALGQTVGSSDTGTPSDLKGEEQGPDYTANRRLLVTGEFRTGKARRMSNVVVWECGWTQNYDSETAKSWRATFGRNEPAAK